MGMCIDICNVLECIVIILYLRVFYEFERYDTLQVDEPDYA